MNKKFWSSAWNQAAGILIAALVTSVAGLAVDEIIFHVQVTSRLARIEKQIGIADNNNSTNTTQYAATH